MPLNDAYVFIVIITLMHAEEIHCLNMYKY